MNYTQFLTANLIAACRAFAADNSPESLEKVADAYDALLAGTTSPRIASMADQIIRDYRANF